MVQGALLRAAFYGAGLAFLTALAGQAADFRRFGTNRGVAPTRRVGWLLLLLLAGVLAGWKLAGFLGGPVLWQLFLTGGLLLPRRFGAGPWLLFLAAFVGAADFGLPVAVFLGCVLGLLGAAAIEKTARSATRKEMADGFQKVAATAVGLIALLGLLGI